MKLNDIWQRAVSTLVISAVSLSCSTAVFAVDAEAAKALATQNNCLKCHSLDKERDGPSFKKTAAKYKGKADAEASLLKHLTTAPKIKLPDGSDDEHKVIKTSPPKDAGQISNLIQFILQQ
jgi:cytochrome c